MTIAAQLVTQDGRHSARGNYAHFDFEVVTGYSIAEDAYPVLVYIGAGRDRRRLNTGGLQGSNVQSALDTGLELVQRHVDAALDGFARRIKR